MGEPDWKIFGSRSGRTDRTQRGPCVLTQSQIFIVLGHGLGFMFDSRSCLVLSSKQLTALALMAKCLVKFENFSLGCLGAAGFIVQRLRTWFRYFTIEKIQEIVIIKVTTHFKQLLDEGFVISRIIKLDVEAISCIVIHCTHHLSSHWLKAYS